MRRRANIAQTEIPTGNEIGRAHDPDEAFGTLRAGASGRGSPLHVRLRASRQVGLAVEA